MTAKITRAIIWTVEGECFVEINRVDIKEIIATSCSQLLRI